MTLTTSSLTEWVRCLVSPQDKAILRELAQRNGSASESATIRRLIREEAQRLGVSEEPVRQSNPAAQ